ncbi:uncharacterized protein LOC105215337 [Zeugodacus cucurbitae]|uniref:uncharacterized protein LOC105215337 n=1 Tax=Zeugodacus cucurbitae TaxID=28588 RepID=UPI0023D95E43|nr:uncharacterized protein LOC105215337 [Zeugodacus cucurbitae]
MLILRCGLLLSILSYQLLAFKAGAQNACLFSSTENGICKTYADCMEIHGKVIFENDACEENTYCCPNNRHNTKHNELEVNLEDPNPPLGNNNVMFKKDPNPSQSNSEPEITVPLSNNMNTNELVVNSNQQNPPLMDEYAKRFWNIFMEDPNPNKNVARTSKPIFEPGVEIIPNINNPWHEDVSIYPDINDSMDEEDTY